MPDSNIVYLADRFMKIRTPRTTDDGGGEPPYDGGMEARVAKLEDFAVETRDRLTRLETKVDNLTDTVATRVATKDGVRADIGAAINTQTWRIIGALAALVAAVFFIARYIH